ncbi:MAG: T9SS type A sorting domain-containing protein [Bacteroidia bacterium]|nr:T9SS type A sorting domain-containing protein [Bacteroidia bacterium]
MGGNPVTATAPTMSWDTNDWASQGMADCFGFQYLPASPPTVTLNPSYTPDCDADVTLSVNATEGYDLGDDTQELAYQWYYQIPGNAGWSAVTNGGDYSGATTATLSISNVLNYYNYQYYCQIREDDSSCFISSDATRLEVPRTIWNLGAWSNGVPDVNTIAIIDDIYNSGSNGDIDACQLIVNTGNTLTVGNSSYVRIVNNVINNGNITVQTRGSFVQDGDDAAAGTFTNSGAGSSNILKTTATFNDAISGDYNYTYWSSPVAGSLVNTVFPNPVGERRFYFAGEEFLDALAEDPGNNNVFNAGQDDIDDDDSDWIYATGLTMEIGRGYAVTAVSTPSAGSNYSDSANFIGDFNTGNYDFTIYRNDSEMNDNNWNFTGNPYPSPISIDAFILENMYLASPVGGFPTNTSGTLDGAVFLWSQSIPANATTNGNENWNFSQNDYAVINLTGETAGNSGVTPNRFIPSGQGFFISYSDDAGTNGSFPIYSNTITYKNSMRVADNSSNNQFFEANEETQNFGEANPLSSTSEFNKLWLDLNSDNGVFNQILVGYVPGATDGFDGMILDAYKNLSSSLYAGLYTFIEGQEKVFTIQGKNPLSLNLDEIIPVGFSTKITEPTLYSFSIPRKEGEFLNTNAIYLKDHLLNITHDLTVSDYSFTSDIGEFNDRFDIRFTEDALSLDEVELTGDDLIILEGENDNILFKLSGNYQMATIEIIDLLGRTVYKLNGEDRNQITYNLSSLSQATYIARVTLTNDKVILKKMVKRK